MTAHPIPFSPEMVAAILSGAKTQTRRPINMARLRVVPRRTVTADPPLDMLPENRDLVVRAGRPYRARMNPLGAVSAVLPGGRFLGLKPEEFDFVCPYADGRTYHRRDGGDASPWVIEAHDSRLWVREGWRVNVFCDGSAPRQFGGWSVGYRDGLVQQIGFGDPPNGRWRPGMFMPRWASRIDLDVMLVRVERLHSITEEDARAEGFASVAHFLAAWDRINGKRAAWATNPWVWAVDFRRVRP